MMKENRTKSLMDAVRDDEALIRSFLKGHNSAFDDLMQRHQDRIFNLCNRFLGDAFDAHDMAQDIFIKAFRNLNTFRFESSFSTWLYRIAVNTCNNRLKSLEIRFKRKLRSISGSNDPENGDGLSDLPDGGKSPLGRLEEKERSDLIQKAINALPKDKRMVVILRDIEGLSYEEIACITGFTPGTVKSKLARARQRLKTTLEGII
jgi:RNA polymerase sigma-70 factor, ECF subfamily